MSTREDEGASAQTQGEPTYNKTDNNERAWIRTVICLRIQQKEKDEKKKIKKKTAKKVGKAQKIHYPASLTDARAHLQSHTHKEDPDTCVVL